MTILGCSPSPKLLMSTSIYSPRANLRLFGGVQSFTRVEISELTRLVHDARDFAIDRLKSAGRRTGRGGGRRRKTYIGRDRPWVCPNSFRSAPLSKDGGRPASATPRCRFRHIPDKDTLIAETSSSTVSVELTIRAGVILRGPLFTSALLLSQARHGLRPLSGHQ